MTKDLNGRSILLIISGGIAAYKALELIRLFKKSGAQIRCILTKGGEQFVTPLSVSALCEEPVYTDIWSLKDETEMGHIRLSREADLTLIAPASADIIAKTTHGMADDLATTTLLAADLSDTKPLFMAPAMNHRMWSNPATQNNIETLKQRGVHILEPTEGDMACGEFGVGRMREPADIFETISRFFFDQIKPQDQPLQGRKALVTSGPTFEPIDPVRYIGNRSSGKQGHAIATALQQAGAKVTLVTGPVALPAPAGVETIHVETAKNMLDACNTAIKNGEAKDIAICAAAVGDWAPEASNQKIKKNHNTDAPTLTLHENTDILHHIAHHKKRPTLVIGFAAETQDLLKNATKKLEKKGCNWILANQVGQKDKKIFGEDENHVYLIADKKSKDLEDWGNLSKTHIAQKLVTRIKTHFETH